MFVRALKLETSLTLLARQMIANIADQAITCAINHQKRIMKDNTSIKEQKNEQTRPLRSEHSCGNAA
jgi:hypothetical protein